MSESKSSVEYCERRKAVEQLQDKIKSGVDANDSLWQAVIAYQGYPFHTASGLLFSYAVKKNKKGQYTGELEISRKEESKTLTKSSVILAFHTVLEAMEVVDVPGEDGEMTKDLIVPEYKGPKAIGQIFGISYLYSLFWNLGLIRVPKKIEDRMKHRQE